MSSPSLASNTWDVERSARARAARSRAFATLRARLSGASGARAAAPKRRRFIRGSDDEEEHEAGVEDATSSESTEEVSLSGWSDDASTDDDTSAAASAAAATVGSVAAARASGSVTRASIVLEDDTSDSSSTSLSDNDTDDADELGSLSSSGDEDASAAATSDEDEDEDDEEEPTGVSAYRAADMALFDEERAPRAHVHAPGACCAAQYALAIEAFLAHIRQVAPRALSGFDFGAAVPRALAPSDYAEPAARSPCAHLAILKRIVARVRTLDADTRERFEDETRTGRSSAGALELVGSGHMAEAVARANARRAGTGNTLVDGVLMRLLEDVCSRRQTGSAARDRYPALRVDADRASLALRLALVPGALALLPCDDESPRARAEAAFAAADFPTLESAGGLDGHVPLPATSVYAPMTLAELLAGIVCDWCQTWRAARSSQPRCTLALVAHARLSDEDDAATLANIDERRRSSRFADARSYAHVDSYVTHACHACADALRRAHALASLMRALATSPALESVAGMPRVYRYVAASVLGAYIKIVA